MRILHLGDRLSERGGAYQHHPGEGLVPWGDVPALARAIREVSERRVVMPAGFECQGLMARLHAVYAEVAA